MAEAFVYDHLRTPRGKGKVNLHTKPKKTAKVKVTVAGTKLATKRLVAVRL